MRLLFPSYRIRAIQANLRRRSLAVHSRSQWGHKQIQRVIRIRVFPYLRSCAGLLRLLLIDTSLAVRKAVVRSQKVKLCISFQHSNYQGGFLGWEQETEPPSPAKNCDHPRSEKWKILSSMLHHSCLFHVAVFEFLIMCFITMCLGMYIGFCNA
jgi:hypothetical protein